MIFLPSAKYIYRPQTTVAPWTPLSLTSTVLYGWYKSDAGLSVSTDGASVATWADQSTNNNHLAQPTLANQGVFRTAANGINGLPVLEFAPGIATSSAQRSINDTSFLGSDSDGFSFYIVSRNLATRLQYGGAWMVGNFGAGGISQMCDLAATGSVSLRFQNGSGDWDTRDAFRTNYSVAKISCGSSINSYKHKSTYVPAQNQPSSSPTNIIMGAGFSIGASYYGSVGSRIAEVIVCKRELDATEEINLNTYLRSRYGFDLNYGADLPVASPALWLDASRSDTLFTDNALTTAATTDNGPVGGWKDLSGNNRHALQTGTNRPTWRTPINGQNGLGMLSFNGSSQWLDISSLPALDTGYTFYGVFKQPTANGYVFCAPGAGTANSTAAITAQPSATVTANGNAQISTAQSKFGGASGYFDGTGDYLDISGTGTATEFGTGDFTIEFWFYPLSVNVQQNLVDKIGSASNAIYVTSAGVLKYYAGADRITGSTLSASTWYHISLVRYAGTTKLYVNGVQSGSSYADANNYALNTGSPRIGAAFNGTASVNGYFDDFRISKFAAYTSAFTPPAGPHPDDGSAVLLLHMDGTNGSTTFVDSSSRAGLTQGNADVSSPAPVAAPVGFVGNYNGGHTTGSYSIRTSLGTSYKAGTMTQAIGTPAAGAARVGRATGTATQYFNSSLYELVVLPRQSTTTEDDAWKTYTAAKWGITWS